ncbi:PEP-CTERM sorting domain-containing protein [Stieleria varia]|uniref:PEP-CTERM protein-sorting domain-containing protein n=1 Tax=Stieleria varia TaxID=2528005 RepID=A0A5C6AL90_9BACT|nr:PEP-CTERM sorting domain-containing protein [Stieleria varia]TWU00783.1 hypothetical protein Pla52n_41520 [Stieleria varia]
MFKHKFPLHALFAVAIFSLSAEANAALLTTLDFTDTNWTTTLSGSGDANNLSTATATTIMADKSSGSGAAQILVELTGSISTLGFQDITVGFDGAAEGLEWDANFANPINSSDGFRIFGSGVEINGNSLNDLTGTTIETDFENGPTTFPNVNFDADFTFDSSVDNSSITSMTFILRINANPETLSVANVQIFGNPISSTVPEPSSLAVAIGLIGCTCMMRRRKN